jgi:hypothetical protein
MDKEHFTNATNTTTAKTTNNNNSDGWRPCAIRVRINTLVSFFCVLCVEAGGGESF